MFNPFADLAGDSGYPLKQWLLTPFPNPQSAEERTYILCHNQAHTVVECAIGLLKGRWRRLDSPRGTLSYNPEKVCTIERVCSVLHNVAQLKDVAFTLTLIVLAPTQTPISPGI